MLAGLAANAGPDVEFVLVDDRSRDRTPALLDEFARNTPRTRVVHLPENRGPSAARNAGLDAAEGRYLVFLDGDDWIEAGYLERLTAVIERLGCDFVRTDHVQVTG